MLISSLCEFYNKVLTKKVDFIPEGYCSEIVHYRVYLSDDGKVDDIISLEYVSSIDDSIKGRMVKHVNRIFPFPSESTHVTVNVPERRPDYLFGLEFKDGRLQNTKRAVKKFFAFRKFTMEFFGEARNNPLIDAYCRFAENWDPSEETQNPYLTGIGKDFNKVYFEFVRSADIENFLQDDGDLKRLWDRHCEMSDDENIVGTCSVYGEKMPIARIHDKIRTSGGYRSGNKLVCVNNISAVSYGMTKGYGASVSVKAMKEYTYALNYLLHNKEYNFKVGRMTYVYFTLSDDTKKEYFYQNLFDLLLKSKREDSKPVNIAGSHHSEKNVMGFISRVFQKLRLGEYPGVNILDAESVEYCVFGMVIPNDCSRISVRFMERNSFGKILDNVERYYADFGGYEAPSFSRMGYELTPPILRSGNEVGFDPGFSEAMMTAMLEGVRFPYKLLYSVILRVRIDQNAEKRGQTKFNDTRDGMIVAYLNRNYLCKENKLGMSLDMSNRNPAYLCGRLFAVLERIQERANCGTDFDKSIVDMYFSSACMNPSSELTKLYLLSTKHKAKLSKADKVFFDKILDEIFEGFSGGFPSKLTLEEQGEFIVGYRHQIQKFFEKKEEIDLSGEEG
ncbi:MAG: type I-C CRISPR-associated protein Cas8c/Csd1 [Clostridia bacterium]|nr:type I-C CRISPR-associated protein Cas8c/Csd1 [Clostridia bacterium]